VKVRTTLEVPHAEVGPRTMEPVLGKHPARVAA